jgi:molybdopterin synthase catalytic subunit
MDADEAVPHQATGQVAERRVARLVGISAAPLDVTAVYDAVQASAAGGVALFAGVVRDHDGGKAVRSLSYTAHPTAEAVLREVVESSIEGHPVEAVAAVHRIGDLAIGDIAVVTVVACGHRGLAFEVCERLIDAIKARVPIWKHQVFADGSDEWVGTPG